MTYTRIGVQSVGTALVGLAPLRIRCPVQVYEIGLSVRALKADAYNNTQLPFSHAEGRSKVPLKRVSEDISEDTNESAPHLFYRASPLLINSQGQENANKRRRTLEIARIQSC